MTDLWLDTAKVARLTGDCARTVRLKAANRDYVSRQHRLARRGRPQLQIALSSLSADAQMKYARLQLDAAQAHALVPADPAQPTLFQSPVEIDVRAWADVPDNKKDEAKHRLKVITPLIEWNAGHTLACTLRDGSAVRNSDDLAQYLAEQHAVSRTSVWRWYIAFAGSKKHPAEGIAGLVRDKRCDASSALNPKSRYFDSRKDAQGRDLGHPEAAKFALAKYAELGQCSPTGSPNLMLIHSELLIERQREGSRIRQEALDRGEDLKCGPSPCTVRNYLGHLPPVIRDAARLTRQKHDAKYAPTVRTNIAATRVNQFWVADHRVFDVLGYNDCCPGLPAFGLFRVWMTAIEDMRSRVMWGVFAATPSWKTIASALRMGMSQFGRPEVFYCDNGKDFKKVGGAYARTPEDMDEYGRIRAGLITENLLQRLGITPQYCLPKHPRSKLIEPAFNYVSQRCDVTFGAGYAGAKPSLRPDQCREAEKQHQAWLQHKTEKTPFLPVSHIVDLISAWFEERNAEHHHSGDGMDGRAPYEVMRELLPSPEPVDVAAIEPLFWEHKVCTVRRTAVQVDNEIYEGVDEANKCALYAANGLEITVAYDPYDPSRALAVADGRVIARLHPKPRIDRGLAGERSPETDAEIQSTLRIGRGAYNLTAGFWKRATAGVPTILDGLRERNGIAAPAPDAAPYLLRSASAPAIERAEPEFIDDLADRFAGGN